MLKIRDNRRQRGKKRSFSKFAEDFVLTVLTAKEVKLSFSKVSQAWENFLSASNKRKAEQV